MTDTPQQELVRQLFAAANAEIECGNPEAAQSKIEQALAQMPTHPALHRLHGRILGMLGRERAAADAFRRATDLDPADAGGWCDLAMALGRLGRDGEAHTALMRAVAIDPASADALERLAVLAYRRRDLAAAIRYGRQAVAADPERGTAVSNLCFHAMFACDWGTLPELGRRLDAFTDKALAAGQAPAETPHLSVIRTHDPARNLAIARATSQSIAERARRQGPTFGPRAGRLGGKIRLGYLSGHFRDHPAGHLCAGLFGLHDRGRFEIVAFADGLTIDDAWRTRIAGDVDRMIDVGILDNLEAAQRIHDENIDVLMLIGGHTRGTRLEICAFRPAPVQIAFIDFPGSLGADFIDYAIVDETVLPAPLAAHFTERPIYLPDCYQPNDGLHPVATSRPTRADWGLPENALVLVAPVSSYKIDEPVFSCWMRVLASAPGSVLWLPGCPEPAAANLIAAARRSGIDPGRIVVSPRTAKPAHLARLALADFALDTWLCNGHTTTSDCLLAGVPVIAIEGAHFATRVSASILAAAGLPELVVQDRTAYEELARSLMRDPGRRRRLREKLDRARHHEPLFDTRRYVRHLETAIIAAWDCHSKGDRPRAIRVGAVGAANSRMG